jgi:hypothetical protein
MAKVAGRPSFFGGLCHDAADAPHQGLEIERLADVGVRRDGPRLGAAVGGHRDERNPRQHPVGALHDPKLPAVHHRHHEIEQDQIGRLRRAAQRLQRLAAVGDGRHRGSLVAQQIGERGTDVLVVFDQEQTKPLQGSAGQHVWEAKDAPRRQQGAPLPSAP